MTGLLDEDDIKRAILQYLAEHPHGADTVAGVAGWWLARHRARVVAETVERVLEKLVADEVLGVSEESGRRVYFLRR